MHGFDSRSPAQIAATNAVRSSSWADRSAKMDKLFKEVSVKKVAPGGLCMCLLQRKAVAGHHPGYSFLFRSFTRTASSLRGSTASG